MLQTIDSSDRDLWVGCEPPSPPAVSLSLVPGSARAETVTSLVGLQEPWRILARQSLGPSLYQSFEWCSAWVEACRAAGRPEDVRIVTVRQDSRIVLLWPLAVRRLGPAGILHALAEPATQYGDLLVERSPRAGEWLDLAWKEATSQPGVDLVHLHNVRSGARIGELAARHLEPHLLRESAAPFLRLAPHPDDPCQDMPRARSGRSINALKRHLKNLRKHGSVEWRAIPVGEHVEAVGEALRLKRRWLDARGAVSAGYDHPANEAAIRALACEGLFTGMRMTVDGTTAAIEIGVLERGHYYSLIQSYDERFAAHAPGRLLLWHMLTHGAAGTETFDFLPPAQPHKTEWTDMAVVVRDYAVPLTAKGRLALFYLRTGKRWMKELYGRLPMALRRQLHRLSSSLY